MVLDVAPLIEPGSVVCVSAGASPRAIGLCVDELGGEVREATIASEDSFVMPLNPDDPAHLNAARNVADLLGLPVRELDPQLVPIAETLNEAVTSYLVIGTSDAPYSLPQNPGEGTPTTLSGTNSVSSVEQIYTVVPGDTVERIAGRYGYPPAQIDVLVEHNGWPSADVILFPGDIVRIPPGAIVPTNE